jgi:predicted metal-dependent phosphoesterase TrpH
VPGFDLHVHTTASDGVLNGEEIIQLAIKLRLEGIAITDHDTIEGLDEGIKLGEKYQFHVIPGIELSTQYQNTEIHILGYYLDYHLLWVVEKLRYLQDARVARLGKMVDKLQKLGYDVDKDEVLSLSGEGSVGRPHLAYLLMKKGYISSVQEAFQRLIGRGCPAYVLREKLTPKEAVDFVSRAGGVPVMAHPGLTRTDKLIFKLKEHGLKGLEVYHPEHGVDEEKKYCSLADRLGLVATGGSDFHGSNKDMNRFSLGSKTVSSRVVENLRQLATWGKI